MNYSFRRSKLMQGCKTLFIYYIVLTLAVVICLMAYRKTTVIYERLRC